MAAILGEESLTRLVMFAQGGARRQAPAVWERREDTIFPCSTKAKGFTEAQTESQDSLNPGFPGLSSQAGLLGEPLLSGVRINCSV